MILLDDLPHLRPFSKEEGSESPSFVEDLGEAWSETNLYPMEVFAQSEDFHNPVQIVVEPQ